MKLKVAQMDPKEAAKILGCEKDEVDFHFRWQIMLRMHTDDEYMRQVVS